MRMIRPAHHARTLSALVCVVPSVPVGSGYVETAATTRAAWTTTSAVQRGRSPGGVCSLLGWSAARSTCADALLTQTVWCGVVWCGVVWCGVVWCGLLWSAGQALLVASMIAVYMVGCIVCI